MLAGTTHIVEDKSSYVVDFNFNRVQAAAKSVESQIESIVMLLQLFHQQSIGPQQRQNPNTADPNEVLFRGRSKKLGLRGLLLLDISEDGSLSVTKTFGSEGAIQGRALDTLGWTARRFVSEPYLVGRTQNQEVVIGFAPKQIGADDNVIARKAYVAFALPDLGMGENGTSFDLYLVDPVGTVVFGQYKGKRGMLPERQIKKLVRPVLNGNFDSGAQLWDTDFGEMIAAYQRLKPSDLTVIGIIPRDAAFSAIRDLILRTLTLGGSILAIAIGLTLVFVRRLTEGLRQMVEATSQVAKGEFSFRVRADIMGNDEIGALGESFNAMAGKIDSLMAQTAAKVATEKNRETIATIQEQFTPREALKHENLQIFGKMMACPEFGGDWWTTFQVRDYAIGVIGHTNHRGVQGALVTAAMHGSLSSYIGNLKANRQDPTLQGLVNQLNSTLFATGKGQTTMNAFVYIFNIHAGLIQMVNCSGPAPWIHRLPPKPKEPPKVFSFRFMRMGVRENGPLGRSADYTFKEEYFELLPEDVMFFHTPGWFGVRNLKGERILSQDRMYQEIAQAVDHFGPQADRVSEKLTEQATAIWGEAAAALPDDATVMILAIPKKAYFVRKDLSAGATQKKAA
ncbi:MAG: HAMP domain-containing protein [Bdellovibrionales bacterium]|nr:HAMP domain-containing protein [Bdellovibrionales bacterium]